MSRDNEKRREGTTDWMKGRNTYNKGQCVLTMVRCWELFVST